MNFCAGQSCPSQEHAWVRNMLQRLRRVDQEMALRSSLEAESF